MHHSCHASRPRLDTGNNVCSYGPQVRGPHKLGERKIDPRLPAYPVAQLDRHERVQAVVGQRCVRLDLVPVNHGDRRNLVHQRAEQVLRVAFAAGIPEPLRPSFALGVAARRLSGLLGPGDAAKVSRVVALPGHAVRPGPRLEVEGHGLALEIQARRGPDDGASHEHLEVRPREAGPQTLLQLLGSVAVRHVAHVEDDGQGNRGGWEAARASVVDESVKECLSRGH